MTKEKKADPSAKNVDDKKLTENGTDEKKSEPINAISAQPNPVKSGQAKKSTISAKALDAKLKGRNISRLGARETLKTGQLQQVAALAKMFRVSKMKTAAIMSHYGWTEETKLLRQDFINKVNAWSTATA